MQNTFERAGDLFQARPEEYHGRRYTLTEEPPPAAWTVQVPTDSYYPGSDPLSDLSHFRRFYAENTGIPGAFRPRPTSLPAPASGPGVELRDLFGSTRMLKYCTADGTPPPVVTPLGGEQLFEQFRTGERKEKCGCGGPTLPMF